MTDSLHRIITDDGKLFGLACDTTRLVNEACRKHDVGPTAGAALGRALTGAALLAALMKEGQHLQLKFEGSGPLAKIITEAGHDGWVRGYVANPRAEVELKEGRVDVAAGLGRAGFLTVTKDIGVKNRYQGMIQLYTSEIGEDIAYYLLESEQTPSVVAVSVQLQPNGTIGAAGGYLIQALPPVDEDLLKTIEERVRQLPSVSSWLLEGNTPDMILQSLFAGIAHHPTGATPLYFQCSCSREKMETALISLGMDGLRNLLEQQGGAEVHCEFCRDSYRFDRSMLEKLLAEERSH